METLLTVLPNLSIGVVSISGLVYVVLAFLKALDIRSDKHEEAMKEREHALRAVEESVRVNLMTHLIANTTAMQESNRVMSRIVRHLDGEKI